MTKLQALTRKEHLIMQDVPLRPLKRFEGAHYHVKNKEKRAVAVEELLTYLDFKKKNAKEIYVTVGVSLAVIGFAWCLVLAGFASLFTSFAGVPSMVLALAGFTLYKGYGKFGRAKSVNALEKREQLEKLKPPYLSW